VIPLLRTMIMVSLLGLMSYFGWITYQHAKHYETTTTQIAKACDANGLASEKIDALTSIISWG